MAYLNKKQKGFTLAEVLVVLVILGIASAIVIPMIGDTSNLRASSAARQIASTLLFTQTSAITDQQQYQVVFDSVNNCYEVQDQDGDVISETMTLGGDYRIDYSSIFSLH